MRHAIIWGRRLQGKSTLALALAISARRSPIIIFDPCSQFEYFPVEPSAVQGIERETPIFRVPVVEDPETAFQRLMTDLDGGVWRYEDYTLVLDETSLLQRPQAIHPALARLIRMGPDEITVIQTLHRPSETHATVRALATDFFFFQTYIQRDLDVISDNYGADVAEAVFRLKRHECLHWWLQPGGEPAWSVWTDPARWFIKIGDRRMDTDETPQETPEETPEETTPAPEPPGVPDPVQESLKKADERIRRLERQNRKLLKRLRADRDAEPTAGSSTNVELRDTIASEPMPPDPPSSDFWGWLSRKD